MASVKLNKKDLLDQLQAKLVLFKNKKLSQQEILDRCIEFTTRHLEEFIAEQVAPLALTPEKIDQILSHALTCELFFQDKSDDELIYGNE
jgi:hypothetical protein